MFAIVDRSRQRGALALRARLLIITASVGLVMAVGALRLSAARTDSFTAGLMPLQTMGPGGPQFKWIREVDEETRRRVTGALDAANRDNDAKVRAVAEQVLQTIRDMPDGTVTVSGQCRGNCFVGPTAFPAAETLAGLLRAPDPQVRALAAIRLDSLIFPPAVPAWIDLLVDGDDSLRERAAISLGAIGDPAAVDALASVLLNDRNADVRRQAARSLGQIAAGS